MTRYARAIAPLLIALLAACGGPSIQGVAQVEILGGDRDVPQGATALLTPQVTAGSGIATTVTWTSSDPSIASVDAAGKVVGLLLGNTEVTATSTADPSKTDTISVQVVVPTGTVRATYEENGSLPPVLGAGLVMLNSSAVAVSRAAMTEIEPGMFVGPISPIDAEGGFNIQFPTGGDLPAELFKPADAFVRMVDTLTDCTLTASVPGVMVTEMVPDQLPFSPFPTVFLVLPEDTLVATVNDATFATPLTPENVYARPFVTWVYAQAAVSIETTGPACATPDAPPVAFAVDVDLVAGWNQLAWTFDWDSDANDLTGARLANSTLEDLYLNVIVP